MTGGGLFVALLGALRPSESEALARARATADRTCVAVLCRRAAWPSPEALQQSEEVLLQAGWTVLEIGSADELARTWPRLPARAGAKGGSL